MPLAGSLAIAGSNSHPAGLLLLILAALQLPFQAIAQSSNAPASFGLMRDMIERYSTDAAALERHYALSLSEKRFDRLGHLYDQRLRALEAVPFETLEQDGRIDYLLLRNKLRFERRELDHERAKQGEVAALIPFSAPIVQLDDARRRLDTVDYSVTAKKLAEITEQITRSRKNAQKLQTNSSSAVPVEVMARRTARLVEELRQTLRHWHDFYAGYDPQFTWWLDESYQKTDGELSEYVTLLRRKAGLGTRTVETAGGSPDSQAPSARVSTSGRRGPSTSRLTENAANDGENENDPIIGDPIGRQALLDALESEMIPYTPEELIDIANKEFAWCEAEYKRAARDLGFGDDWRKALEHVKELYVKPGEQPKLIKDLAQEAVTFLNDHDLVTIPELCNETWRIEMMSPERQRVNPFFTGGEVISVSYPTAAMSFADKQMSMRGNNIHFSRATVFHELIPGHHLQSFMASRYRAHRRIFQTPFLGEGWALYWEMLLWDLKFPRSAEDRIGMLFWRSHRCARIIFSLNFHLGKMTPQEAVDFLVERVGHERRNATAEVRRSFTTSYAPLYQAAYMLGGLQLRALHKELVDSGKMTNRQFHDAVLKENSIPIELIRASLTHQSLTRDYTPKWRFYETDSKEKVASASSSGKAEANNASAGKPQPVANATNAASVYRDKVEPHWFAGDSKFWYRVETGQGRAAFILVDANVGTREPAFDHERLAKALSEKTGKTIEADRLPFEFIRFNTDEKSVSLLGDKLSWRCDLANYDLAELKDERPPARTDRDAFRRGRGNRFSRRNDTKSPDGKWQAFVRDNNLFLRNLETKAELTLTTNGTLNDTYARDVQRDRAMELEYDTPDSNAAAPDVFWSPDSRHLVAMRTRAGTNRNVYLVESSPKDQLQPKLQSYPYLKPGDEIPIRKPHLFEIERAVELSIDDSLFKNPWSINELRWASNSARFTFLYNQRGHQVLRILAVDAASGRIEPVVDEQSQTFIDYSGKQFTEYLDDTDEIIWMSERDGWNHLYLYDARSAKVKNQITKGEWVVRGVDRVDKRNRQIWFRAGGIRPAHDPYFIHYCRINFDGTGLTILTEGDGTHTAQFSPDRRFFIDTWSRVDLAPVNELRQSQNGKLVCKLEESDTSLLAARARHLPERFMAKGRDGTTDIYGIIHRPKNFDPKKNYPVIESIYAGPHGSFVPKGFRASYGVERLADRGFIIVQIDGMGTSNRSKKFHDICWKNLGDAGFPDRILWMKAAAAKYPYMDLSRVGIYGGSAGGQSALRALLAYGDFYKAAAADCGCHDNRMDKIWWNEQWMGWPVGPHYAEQSNVTQAHKLQGKLLLTVAELDKNVDPSSTMQVVNALIKANKDFELIVFPGAGHGAGSSPYGERRRADFFVHNLLETTPHLPQITSQ